MSVDPETLARFREIERRMEGQQLDDSMQALTSVAEVLAYVGHWARAEGHSEAEQCVLVELTLMDSGHIEPWALCLRRERDGFVVAFVCA